MGSICCANTNNNPDDEESEENKEKFSHEKLRKKIKEEILKLHSEFKENIEDNADDMMFTLERIKLVLSEFSDVVDNRTIASTSKVTMLDDLDFVGMEKFLEDLDKLNTGKVKKEEDYLYLLEKNKALIEKVAKVNMEILNCEEIMPEDKPPEVINNSNNKENKESKENNKNESSIHKNSKELNKSNS